MTIRTFQDFEAAGNKSEFIADAILQHKSGRMWRTAHSADSYDRQENETITHFVRELYTLNGAKVKDFTASNNRIASNFFNRLNTQRCMYSLGKGISFVNADGTDATDLSGEDTTKAALGGAQFDQAIKKAGYLALIHGVSFCFWNLDRVHVFPVTEFVPLWDEDTGALRAGIRFWRLDADRPVTAVLYEEDGYTVYKGTDAHSYELKIKDEKRAYKVTTQYTPTSNEVEVVSEENYTSLPIVPLWGNRLHQSTLVGMREAIDAYDLIKSGFANDVTDCAEIYWLFENAGGMDDKDLQRQLDRLKLTHAATVDSDDGTRITPYTQEIPYNARQAALENLKAGIYEDFGALDVHTIAASSTNDHIDAAYQPLDEQADDFEQQLTECILQLLDLAEIEDTPIYTRNRISNQLEQVQIVVQEAQWLDEETVLRKLPNITPEEVSEILERKETNSYSMFNAKPEPEEEAPEAEEETA